MLVVIGDLSHVRGHMNKDHVNWERQGKAQAAHLCGMLSPVQTPPEAALNISPWENITGCFFFFSSFFLNFGDRVLLRSSGWPRTCYTNHTGFKLIVILVNAEVTDIHQRVWLC